MHLYFVSSNETSPLKFGDSFSLSSHPELNESIAEFSLLDLSGKNMKGLVIRITTYRTICTVHFSLDFSPASGGVAGRIRHVGRYLRLEISFRGVVV
jgi:hypothetical protein